MNYISLSNKKIINLLRKMLDARNTNLPTNAQNLSSYFNISRNRLRISRIV